jgi:hypothetical protein
MNDKEKNKRDKRKKKKTQEIFVLVFPHNPRILQSLHTLKDFSLNQSIRIIPL